MERYKNTRHSIKIMQIRNFFRTAPSLIWTVQFTATRKNFEISQKFTNWKWWDKSLGFGHPALPPTTETRPLSPLLIFLLIFFAASLSFVSFVSLFLLAAVNNIKANAGSSFDVPKISRQNRRRRQQKEQHFSLLLCLHFFSFFYLVQHISTWPLYCRSFQHTRLVGLFLIIF